jgi:Flp pilus assembly secretin CpaC
MVNMPESSKILKHLEAQNEKLAQAQQMQMQMQEQQMAMQQQQVAAAQQQAPQVNLEVEQAKAQIEIQKRVAEIKAKLEADIALETAKAGIASNAREEELSAQDQRNMLSGMQEENRSTM